MGLEQPAANFSAPLDQSLKKKEKIMCIFTSGAGIVALLITVIRNCQLFEARSRKLHLLKIIINYPEWTNKLHI